jgi:hypothetical protein
LNESSKLPPESAPDGFAADLQASMHGLRGALTELLASMDDDPSLPQEVSRRYAINKNLSWKVCKIINATDGFESVQNVPGLSGMKIACDAFRKAGAAAARLAAVMEAFEAFNEMVRMHVGDRATLELYVGSRLPEGVHSEQLEDKRRLAYQGNSAIWGVQARLGMALRLIAPNAEDSRLADIANVGGLFGFRRLRSQASWPVLQQQMLGEDLEFEEDRRQPIDPECAPDGPHLVREFCSTPVPETRTIVEGNLTIHELCPGPVGMTAAVDVTVGTVSRGPVPVHGDSPQSVGEHYCRVDTPVEAAQFDLLVHRDLPFDLPPRFLTYSRLHGDLHFPLSRHSRFHLPGIPDVQDLGSAGGGMQTPHIRDYVRLVTLTCTALGHERDAFRAFRVWLTFPPMPTVLTLVHPLGRAPAGH